MLVLKNKMLWITLWIIGSSLCFAWYTSWYYIKDAWYYIGMQAVIFVLLYYSWSTQIRITIWIYIALFVIMVMLSIYNFTLFSSVSPIYRTCFVLFLYTAVCLGVDCTLRSVAKWGGVAHYIAILGICCLQGALFTLVLCICGYLIIFNRTITAETFFPVFQSNPTEVYEFITSVIPYPFWIVMLFLFYGMYYIQRGTVQYLGAKHTSVIVFATCSLLVILIASNAQRHILLYKIFQDAKELYYSAPTMYAQYRDTNLRAVQSEIVKKQGLYIVVLGESATRMGLGAYGYYRETTPFLSSKAQSENYILMTNVYAPATATEQCIYYMLTNTTQYSTVKKENVLSLIDILHTAGVRTIWVSNQSMLEIGNTQVRSLAEHADSVISDMNGIVQFAQYDTQLLPHIRTVLEQNIEEPTVLFIHLYGSHINFCRRYDSTKYSIFTNKPEYAKHEQYTTINCYDNSIYATDDLLRHITEMAEKQPHFKMLLYVSDHGEGTYRGTPRGNSKSLPDVVRVPLYFYMSEQYIKEHKERVTTLRHNAHRGYSTDMLFDTLLGLFDIKTNWYRASYDISSPAYTYTYEDIKTLSGAAYVKDILAQEYE